jgi:hypothetical protein
MMKVGMLVLYMLGAMGARQAAVVGAAAVIGLAGCYGSTEQATSVTFDSAQLNARGTADNGPAESYFEYGPTDNGAFGLRTQRRSWPAGASGAFSERIGGPGDPRGPLYASTAYSYRVCGNDVGKQPVCAQARTFTTPAPVKDAAEGGWQNGLSPGFPAGGVNASAGPSGQSPSGMLRHQLYAERTIFSGRVTCLNVSGRTAIVGAVGAATTDGAEPDPNTNPPTHTSVVTIVDGGPPAIDKTGVTLSAGSTPPSCATGPPANGSSIAGTVNVYDAP